MSGAHRSMDWRPVIDMATHASWWAKSAAAAAVLAALLAGSALAVALDKPAQRYQLACEQQFTDARTGRAYPVWFPCTAVRP